MVVSYALTVKETRRLTPTDFFSQFEATIWSFDGVNAVCHHTYTPGMCSRHSESDGSDTEGNGSKSGQERSGTLGSELNTDSDLDSLALLGISFTSVDTLGVGLGLALELASSEGGIHVLSASSEVLLVRGKLGLGRSKRYASFASA